MTNTTTPSPESSSTTATEEPTPTPPATDTKPETPSCEAVSPGDTPTPEALGQVDGNRTTIVLNARRVYRGAAESVAQMYNSPYLSCLATMVRILFNKVSPKSAEGKEHAELDQREYLDTLGVSSEPGAHNTVIQLKSAYEQLHDSLAGANLLAVCDLETRLVWAAEAMRIWFFDQQRAAFNQGKVDLIDRLKGLKPEIGLALGTAGLDPDNDERLLAAIQQAGIPVTSTSAEVLARYQHPALELLANYRRSTAMLPGYESIISTGHKSSDNRFEWDTWGTSTGQLDCTDPAFQQYPEGTDMYSNFVRYTGKWWITRAEIVDANVRVMAYASGDTGMVKALQRGGDFHRLTTAALYSISPEAVTDDNRLICATVMDGIASGLNSEGLATKLTQATEYDFTADHAKQWMAVVLGHYPKLGAWLRELREKAREATEARTLKLGRRVVLPAGPEHEDFRYGEIVKLAVQGTYADVINTAIVALTVKTPFDGIIIGNDQGELIVAGRENTGENEKVLVGTLRTEFSKMIPGIPVEIVSETTHRDSQINPD